MVTQCSDTQRRQGTAYACGRGENRHGHLLLLHLAFCWESCEAAAELIIGICLSLTAALAKSFEVATKRSFETCNSYKKATRFADAWS